MSLDDKTFVKAALQMLKKYVDRVEKQQFFALYTQVNNDTWSAMVDILLSKELGYTPKELLAEQDAIPPCFFFYLDNLDVLDLNGYNIKFIDHWSIIGCNNLYHIDIPLGVERICSGAIKDCLDLEEIHFPPGIRGVDAANPDTGEIEPIIGYTTKHLRISRNSQIYEYYRDPLHIHMLVDSRNSYDIFYTD